MHKKFFSIIISILMILTFVSEIPNNQVKAYSVLKKGIDVSVYQGNISWNSVAASGIEFAIIRCGTTNISDANYGADKNFSKNYNGAVSNGIKVGTYMYTSANTKSEMKSNVDSMLRTISGCNFTYPIFLDVEQATRQTSLGKSALTDIVLYGLGLISDAGYEAGLYANYNWLTNYVDRTRVSDAGYTIWMARYPSGDYAVDPTGYDYSNVCSMWQYSSKGSVSGISGNVDVDVSYQEFGERPEECGFSLSGAILPADGYKHTLGKNFGLYGTVYSNHTISSLWGGVYNLDGTSAPGRSTASIDNINSTAYNLGGYFNNTVIFDDIPEGRYFFSIVFATPK